MHLNIKSSSYLRNKFFVCRLILLVSLFWVLVDVFLIFSLTDRLYAKKDLRPRKLHFSDIVINNYVESTQLTLDEEQMRLVNGPPPGETKYSQNENPRDWPGEQGLPYVLPKHLEKLAKEKFKENSFNVMASDMIALNRSVGEQRNKKCLKKTYDADLPTTSVIIIYHNEANSTLLRGLTSIVRKTPLKYLKEIILVDDCSQGREYLHAPLDAFVKTLPVEVTIFRNEKRQGLIRSRLIGASVATGDTLTFLDAHIEATDGWVEPLLSEIKKNRFDR